MKSLLMLLAGLVVAAPAYAGDGAFRLGTKINALAQKADQAIQQKLDDHPQVSEGITQGLNATADLASGMVNPEATTEERGMNREAVNMMINPSDKVRQRAGERLMERLR